MTGIKTNKAPSVAGKKGFSLISNEKFRQLYAALLQCEMLDQRLRASARFASCYQPWTGSLASSSAVAACLRRADTIIPTSRAVLANYLRSGVLACIEKTRASESDLSAAHHDALAHKLKKRGGISVVFAPTPQPALMREIFTPAAKQSLPILYILQGATPPADLSHGIPIIRVDASDTVAAYRVAYESITRAREGGGPTIIECAPWPGDPQASNPLLKLELYLAAKKLFRPNLKHELELKFSAAIEKAITSPIP